MESLKNFEEDRAFKPWNKRAAESGNDGPFRDVTSHLWQGFAGLRILESAKYRIALSGCRI